MWVCLGEFRLLWGLWSAKTNLGQFQPVWANMGQFLANIGNIANNPETPQGPNLAEDMYQRDQRPLVFEKWLQPK